MLNQNSLSEFSIKTGHRPRECKDEQCSGTCFLCVLYLCGLCNQAEGELESKCPKNPNPNNVLYLKRREK